MSAIDLYAKGTRVWLKDVNVVWKPSVVVESFDGQRLVVKDEDLATKEIVVKEESNLPPLRNPEILIGENDLTSLSYLHEPAVLHNLSVRFLRNEAIYTYCGIVLVAINPYTDLQIYGNDTISMYRGKNMGDLDPHVYAVAEEAFTKMERDELNQSIIVSGESGAGKTVSAKYAMRYFATVGGTSQTETNVEKKVLASSPIMEAIGNAKTTRNDNSSRFGKYTEIDFNKQYHIVAANMRTYLLEKSRVVFQAPDERNYHIFYQLCAVRDQPDYQQLNLKHPDEFVYLNQGASAEIDGVNDAKEFQSTIDAFQLLGFSSKERKNIFMILSGILYLGNVSFEHGSGRTDSESSAIQSGNQSLKRMAGLLGVAEDQIRHWLCHRKIVTARETFTKPMRVTNALFARDALAKCIYSKLFDWIVLQINRSLKRKSVRLHKFIGVLDIYGFETFESNSFEQFCINYANEKLQQQFNSHVFKLEQEEYLKEGIEWTMIEFYDNQPCIDLIESKLGILDLLDEECRMPKGSDQSWVDKLYAKCRKWEQFSKPRLSNSAFIIRHFADKVDYECNGFLDKNRDTVMEEQKKILKASQNDLLSDLFLETASAVSLKPPSTSPKLGAGQRLNKKTVGSQFRDSLNLLMATLNQTTPHYIRCIKPNDDKAAFQFDPKRGIQQLRACGVLETIRISAAGFPSRWTYQDFYLRYRVLCHSKDVQRSDSRGTCERIVTRLVSDDDKYKFGKTKIFFRAGQVAYMERLRSERLRDCGVMIQKHVKGWLYHKKYLEKRKATVTLQRHVRGFLARRRVLHMREKVAAIAIQRHVRGWVKRKKYRELRWTTIALQARMRGCLARRRHLDLVREAKATVVQARVRGWLQRLRYAKARRQILIVQCQVRRRQAKNRLKKLKIEAKSVEHQKKLNQGLENKIISLQQRLTEAEKSGKKLKALQEGYGSAMRTVEALKAENDKNKSFAERIVHLEETVRSVSVQLDKANCDKIDLVNQKQKDLDEYREKEEKQAAVICTLKSELDTLKKETDEKNAGAVREALAKLGEEKTKIQDECDQERMAYQKLLKAYNRLEAQLENAQDELKTYHGENTMSLTSSMVASDYFSELPDGTEGIDESISGRSSVRSTLAPERGRVANVDWKISGPEPDVALTVKLQQKLKETENSKEKLERKVELLEAGSLSSAPESWSERTSELERRREECIQLRTVLDNVPSSLSSSTKTGELFEAEELLVAFEEQKRVITQLQEQINEGQSQFMDVESELREELEDYKQTCQKQQNLIQQAIGKGPANNTEACLQHEITRLTGENFDLRERIDMLNANKKQLKRMVKAYMKKLSEVGAAVPDLTSAPAPDHGSHPQGSAVEIMSAVVLKKQHDYLGLFEYNSQQEDLIMKSLVYDLKPKIAVKMLPGLPAFVLFMMIRYADYIKNEACVRSLIQNSISWVKKTVKKKGMNDLEVKTLWLSNVIRLLNNLQQYSGETQFQTQSTPKQVEQCLRNFDLTQFKRVLMDVGVWIYQGVTKFLEEEVEPILVAAILEHEEFSGIRTAKPNQSQNMSGFLQGDKQQEIDPQQALDRMLRLLTRFYSIFTKHSLDPDVISSIFRQLFFFICAESLNTLLLSKELCHWLKGMQIRYNIAQLEQWARDQKVHEDKNPILDSLQPIIQACQLLQARKSDEDVDKICEMCDNLKVSQILKILNLYTPADEFEERVTPSFVRKVQTKLHDRAEMEKGQQATLLLDKKFYFAIKFQFCPSSIQMEELEIPEFYNNLHNVLKKV